MGNDLFIQFCIDSFFAGIQMRLAKVKKKTKKRNGLLWPSGRGEVGASEKYGNVEGGKSQGFSIGAAWIRVSDGCGIARGAIWPQSLSMRQSGFIGWQLHRF